MRLSWRSPRSVLFGGDDPVLDVRLTVAHHGRGRVELAAAHDAGPQEAPVLGALRFRLEAHRVAGRRGLVHRVRIAVAIAGRRAEAPVLEDERIGVAGGLAALDEDAFEAAPVEGVGFG